MGGGSWFTTSSYVYASRSSLDRPLVDGFYYEILVRVQLLCVLSVKERFRIPDTLSSLRGRKECFFFIKPQGLDHHFAYTWTSLIRTYSMRVRHTLRFQKRNRLKLVNHDLLAVKIDYLLEDNTLDFANVRVFEDTIFILDVFPYLIWTRDRANVLAFLLFAGLEMSFDPSKLLANVHHKAKDPRIKVTASLKGKKARKDAPKMSWQGWGRP